MACLIGSLLERIRALAWKEAAPPRTRKKLESLAQRVEFAANGLDPAQTRRRRAKPRSERAPAAEAAPPAFVSAPSHLLAELRSSEWSVRADAAKALAAFGDPEAVDALVHALGDSSVEVAVNAAAALGAVGGEGARAGLLAVVQGGDGRYSSTTRTASLFALDALLAPDETEPLRAATRDFDADVSVTAIGVLAARGGHVAAGELLGIVEDETGFFMPTTRLAAAHGLSRVAPLDATGVERAWSREQDPAVYDALSRVVARLRGSAAG
jgi:HEAT repeats